jgi:hypothetical protein
LCIQKGLKKGELGMKKIIKTLLLLLVIKFSFAGDLPQLSAEMMSLVTAKVISIDQETRAVTLKLDNGEKLSFTAGKDVINLDQVKKGDIVTAEYRENIDINLTNDNDKLQSHAQIMTRVPKGSMPGATFLDVQELSLIIDSINKENNTFKLKFPNGEIRQFIAINPANLDKVKVGQTVLVKDTKTLTFSVN